MISGASGGVGSALIQLAKARGAHVIAITSPVKTSGAELGADQVIAARADLVEALGESSVNVMIPI